MGVTEVKGKREKPPWIPGASARRDDPSLPKSVKPGPDNPLGEYVLYLGWPTYLIHGTNDPRGVGRHSSRGCIRLYPNDIAEHRSPGRARVVNEAVSSAGRASCISQNPDAEELQLDETARGDAGRPQACASW